MKRIEASLLIHLIFKKKKMKNFFHLNKIPKNVCNKLLENRSTYTKHIKFFSKKLSKTNYFIIKSGLGLMVASGGLAYCLDSKYIGSEEDWKKKAEHPEAIKNFEEYKKLIRKGKTREAIECLKTSANYNHITSALLLTNLLPEGGAEWEQYMRIAASLGNPHAQLALGLFYEKRGDKSRAVVW